MEQTEAEEPARYEKLWEWESSNGRAATRQQARMSALFFHRGISRLHSEELLLQEGADGSFLVRDSESVTGAYVLCLLYQSRVHQYRILPDKDGRISVQSEGDMQPPSYNDLPSLVTSYISKGEKNGLVCALKKPVSPEGAEIPEADSEDDDFDDPKQTADAEGKSGVSKTFKFGLLNNFARLDLSSCDGEFVDAIKAYVDEGLEKDSEVQGADGAGYAMPEFQKLLAVAGKGLQRELDLFLLKLSMCHDMLCQEEEDRNRTLTSNPMDRLGSYIDFMAAKLENCRTQIVALEKKAKEVVAENAEVRDNEYAYPDCADLDSSGLNPPFLPLGLRRNSSISIPLSTFEVKVLKYGKVNYKLKLTVDIHQGRFFAVKPSKDLLDSSNTFPHDKIVQLVKNTSDNSRLHVIFSNKKKYLYQFQSVLERENFCLQIRQMKSLHSQEHDVDNVSIFVGTWNMGKSAPCESLKYWLKCNGEGKSKDRVLSRLPHDVYVIGTQESAMTEKDWINTIKAGLKASLNLDVDLLESSSLWGLRTLVFINSRHRNKFSHIQKASVRTGIANALGKALRDLFTLVLNKLDKRDFTSLLEQDQLRRCQFEKKALFGFNESEINFMPTYRFERQKPGHHYDWKKVKATGERINVPSWCDRVLWHSFPGTFIENTAYGTVDNLLNSDHRPVFASFTVGIASPFVQNRLSLQDNRDVKFIFKKIEAQIKTSTKQFYILEFSSSCLPDIVLCESNKRFGESQKSGFTNNPIWSSDQLPVLRPLFGDVDYLEDQHILIAVKGCGEDQESYGECVISLKDMFTEEPCYFEATMTHFGEETGKMKGEWYIETGIGGLSSKASRKTYEIVALDTEYHDPEEFLSLSPPVDLINLGQSNSTAGGSSRFFPTPEQDAETFNYVNHHVIKRAPSDPVPECPVLAEDEDIPAEAPPPIPTKKGKAQAMGGQFVMPGASGQILSPVVVPLGTSTGKPGTPGNILADFDDGEVYTDGDELNAQLLALNGGAKQFATAAAPLSTTTAGLQPPTRLPRADGTASSSSSPAIAIKPKVLVNVGGNPPLPGQKPALPRKPESPPIRTSPLVWQTRVDGNDFQTSSSSSHSSSSSPPVQKSKIVPSAPPLPPEENIYPSIAIRKYEELKKPATVPEWLLGLGLGEYTPLFLRHGWDSMAALPGLNAASIMKMGIRDGEHRLRILDSVRELRGSS
ncbi:phosphatidylinositol-3,4,5-trisphosphate 5-phosphatase 2 [Elysia marginata]|uniref:phosphatidylinositol-3,4,5-trisphosphate 5-phosphatase n=1 Tax=Elysia marginata TaxID=1093978 RepID=A0AAV4GM47_9GAST|nr:phosphatidylinositol-3,4,5-trisphosphate 5-phosphatase 2 [Elysia marginata]